MGDLEKQIQSLQQVQAAQTQRHEAATNATHKSHEEVVAKLQQKHESEIAHVEQAHARELALKKEELEQAQAHHRSTSDALEKEVAINKTQLQAQTTLIAQLKTKHAEELEEQRALAQEQLDDHLQSIDELVYYKKLAEEQHAQLQQLQDDKSELEHNLKE